MPLLGTRRALLARTGLAATLFDFTTMSALPASSFTFSRASQATYYDSTGTMQTAVANQPRFDYDLVTHVVRGLLREEQRTNLFLYSTDLTNAVWFKNNTSLVSSGTLNGLPAFTASNVPSSNSFFSQNGLTLLNSTTYVRSIIAKAVSGTGILVFESSPGITTFDLNAGTVSGAGGAIIPQGNGVYRCIQTLTTAATGTPADSVYYIGAYGSTPTATTILLGAPQLEQGTFPTSYIPTATAAATRAADVIQLTGSALAAFKAAHAVIGEWLLLSTAFTADVPLIATQVSGATDTDIYVGGSDKIVKSLKGQTSTILQTTGAVPAVTAFRSGYSTSGAGRSLARDGGTVATDSSALDVGATSVALGGVGQAYIRKLAIYPTRLPDAQLQAKTVAGASLP